MPTKIIIEVEYPDPRRQSRKELQFCHRRSSTCPLWLSEKQSRRCGKGSIKESNTFSHIHQFVPTLMRDTIPKHHENEATFVVSDKHNLSGRRNFFSNLDSSEKSSSQSASKTKVKNLMPRQNIDPLSSISVRPVLCQRLAGLSYITPKSSSITSPIESSLSLSIGVSRKEAACRSGDNPTASIETKYWNTIQIPLAKHDRYDDAIKAYRRRRRGSSPSARNYEKKVAGTTNEDETNDKVNTKYSASKSTFPQRTIERRAEIIEIQKRKSRNNMSLSSTTSESSSSDIKMQPSHIERSITIGHQNKLTKHVCYGDGDASIMHRMPYQVQVADGGIMRQQQKHQVLGRSIKSPKARNISSPRSTTSKLMATKKTSHKQSSEKSFTNVGVGSQLSRAELRKARAREGRHRMVS